MPDVLPRPEQSLLGTMHFNGLQDMFEPRRMGFVRNRDEVIGFTSHRYTDFPELYTSGQAAPSWRITRLELVSLLKHDTPVVYVSDHLP